MSNPKDSMKSSWRTDKSQWSFPHKVFDRIDLYHNDLHRGVPVHSKQDKLPHLPDWHMHRWVIVHAGLPLLAH